MGHVAQEWSQIAQTKVAHECPWLVPHLYRPYDPAFPGEEGGMECSVGGYQHSAHKLCENLCQVFHISPCSIPTGIHHNHS